MGSRTVAIIQARMGSRRLPGKILADVAGQPLLAHVVRRAQHAKTLDVVAVATSSESADDVVESFCTARNIPCFRGSETDVLDRYYRAAEVLEATTIVRLTADCPLLDPAVIDRVVRAFHGGGYDYVANSHEPTFPDGLDTEVFSREALNKAWREARLPADREHVTAFIWRQPRLFRLGNVENLTDLSALRWTVDEPEDLEFVRRIYEHMGGRGIFGLDAVLRLLADYPAVGRINRGIRRSKTFDKSGQRLYARARRRIPGGTQLLSKRPEMFLPEQWPSYYRRARGAEVWDLDGRRYVDMSYSGIGACVLGAADPDVDQAVISAIQEGSASTLNAPEEVELADLLCELHPWAQMVRYTRSGGEAMAVAVRIARASTGRDLVAFCGYHGWHDWYLAANLAHERALDGHLLPGLDPAGVPRGLLGTAIPFHYNRSEELAAIAAAHPRAIAAVVMEPVRNTEPAPGFLAAVRETASSIGAVLVVDEISSGFRLACGGAHLCYGLEPDVAVFAKAMSNGYPMAAVIGKAEIMQAAQATFISSTNWTERIGPTAALATIRKFRRDGVHEHLCRIGRAVQAGWRVAGERTGLPLHISGIPPLGHFSIEGEATGAARTFYTQLMLERGYLATGAFYASYAHSDEHVTGYLEAAEDAFGSVAKALADGTVVAQLKGPIAHAGFERLT